MAATHRIPSHTVANIAAAAKHLDTTGKTYIADVPEALLSPMMVIAKLHEDADEKEPANERFYVDETNMVERRFMKGSTEEFESNRDVDPFAESSLYETTTECVLAHPDITTATSSLATKAFLDGKASSLVDGGSLDMVPLLRDNALFEDGRIRYQKEHPGTSFQEESNVFVDTKADDLRRTQSLGYMAGRPIVVESESGNTRVYGPSPESSQTQVFWVRGVVDGWLGVLMSAGDAEKRFTESELTRYNPDPAQNGSPFLRHKKLRVTHLKSAYEIMMGEKPGKLKKSELVLFLAARCLWGIHLAPIMDAITN